MERLLQRREKRILEMLTAAGFEAYFVGGCVRDALLGEVVADVDITTSAMPQQVKEVFAGWHVIETGIKHGTVTVVLPSEETVEVTTYRSDGTYTDNRHPDKVQFVGSLTEDLARRDFTINAMACDMTGNIIDPFGGQQDLKTKSIRAVGEVEQRFKEDALRIMRALRFAATLSFSIEKTTEEAIFSSRHRLREISAERIFSEFKKLITGKGAGMVIRRYVDVLGELIPELSAMKGFQQHNAYHRYDVLEHCTRAMEQVEITPQNGFYMKLAALLHDVGKPEVFTMDEAGVGHFYGHPAVSEALVRRILGRLKADKFTLERVCILVKNHDLLFREDERLLKKWMRRLGPDVLAEILQIKLADNIATGNMGEDLAVRFAHIRDMIEEILRQQQCFSLKDLAVGGRDLMDAGISQGPEVGQILESLLEAVIEERCANEKEALLALMKSVDHNIK